MSDDIESILNEWKARVEAKKVAINAAFDKGLLKAALYCEGEAKKNAMEMIYNVSIPNGPSGRSLWKRTGLYKASISSGVGSDLHSSYITNSAPYAHKIEYGSSDTYGAENPGRQGRPIMSNAIFNNKENIKTILNNYLKEVTR